MAHRPAPECIAPAKVAREIDEIIAALTERGFYVMGPEGAAARLFRTTEDER